MKRTVTFQIVFSLPAQNASCQIKRKRIVRRRAMASNSTFQRKEVKYRLSPAQLQAMLVAIDAMQETKI